MKLLKLLYGVTGLVFFLILVWLLAVPNSLIKEKIEDAVSRSGNGSLSLSIEGIRKGILFTLYADAVNLCIEDKPALRISDFYINFNPRYLTSGRPAFDLKGKIGTGSINGILKLPLKGNFKIEGADLDAIPYLTRSGMDIKGHLSSSINLNENKADAVFKVPDLDIKESPITVIPLIETFRMIQGSLRLTGNDVTVDSISLEGEKGFARLKGNITNGNAKLILELMPVESSLNALESTLIGKYTVSPGYYVVPIDAPIAIQ
jgi:type II secretion system protein N